jgi:hypothetical protein
MNTLKTICIVTSILFIGCNNQPKGEQIFRDTSAVVSLSPPQPIEAKKIILSKVSFNKIIFGGERNIWNLFAADFASKREGVTLSEVDKEYHIKVSVNGYHYYIKPEFSSLSRKDKKGNIYNYEIINNSSDHFLSHVNYIYSATTDFELLNLLIQTVIENNKLKFKYGDEDIFFHKPQYDPNDPFLGIYEDFQDDIEDILERSRTLSTENNNANDAYIDKKRNNQSITHALFEGDNCFFGFEGTINSSYTVDKIGDKHSIKDTHSTFHLKVTVFPKSYASPDIFEIYATDTQKEQKYEEDATKKLIEKVGISNRANQK